MNITNLQDVLTHEIEDLYSAENQLVEALPKMAEKASSPKLKKAFEDHLAQTEEHVERLEEVAKILGIKVKGSFCKGMEGLIKEGSEILKEEASPALDAALISAAQRVEHYEMAGYGSAIAFATTLKQKDAVKILKETLTEEEKADEKLSSIAEKEVNKDAMEE